MAEYPEHEKLHLVADKSQKIGEFIDWLSAEKGVHLASWICPGHTDFRRPELPEYIHEDTDDCDNPHLSYQMRSIESLLAEFFEIDLVTLEDEKRAMLEAQRALNDRVASSHVTHTDNEESA